MKRLLLAAVAVLALVPFSFVCYEIVVIGRWPESLLSGFEPWLPAMLATGTALTALFVPWITDFIGDQDSRL